MKIYVAASFEQKEETKQVQKQLIEAGHEITLDWTTHKLLAEAPDAEKLHKEYAVADVDGVKTADVYVLLLGERKSAGAHIELGVALGADLKHIYLVGEIKDFTLFYKHPEVKIVPDIEALITELGQIEQS